ncbi:hypothetical protein ACU4GD_35415 [Cupriavidus basilensis]
MAPSLLKPPALAPPTRHPQQADPTGGSVPAGGCTGILARAVAAELSKLQGWEKLLKL